VCVIACVCSCVYGTYVEQRHYIYIYIYIYMYIYIYIYIIKLCFLVTDIRIVCE